MFYRFPVMLHRFLNSIFIELFSIMKLLWPYLVVIAAFIIFLVRNGGVVVGKVWNSSLKRIPLTYDTIGDKSNHEVSFHGAQLLYFLFVASTGFGFSLYSVSKVHAFADSIRRQAKSMRGFLFLVGVSCAVLLVIHFGSPIHKFLLADNRHYTFYVWRKFFRKHSLAKFVPLLLYLFQGWHCWTELRTLCDWL